MTEKIKNVVESVKEAVGGKEGHHHQSSAYAPLGESREAQQQTNQWRTASDDGPHTSSGVVQSAEEAGHRMQEQQGADNPGYYNVQQQFKEKLEETRK